MEELVAHIESQFTPEMSWEALLRGEIHIDHRRPICSFNFNSHLDPDFKECWDISNLRPLWAVDNLKKIPQDKALKKKLLTQVSL